MDVKRGKGRKADKGKADKGKADKGKADKGKARVSDQKEVQTGEKGGPAKKVRLKNGDISPWNGRKVIYDKRRIVMMCEGGDEPPADHEFAMEMLDWQEEPPNERWGEEYGKKIRFLNNGRNRPFDEAHCRKITQDHLTRDWRFNMENAIIGETGLTLSAQHRFAALVLAWQRWRQGPESHHWKTIWPDGPPTMEICVAYGCSEDPAVIRTLDNVKPRSMSDVLFSEGEVFHQVPASQRKRLTNMVDFAIRFIWMRTGMKDSSFEKERTNSQAVGFLERHPRLLEAIEKIYQIYKNGPWKAAVARMTPGYAAGLFYLMAVSRSKRENYKDSLPKSEEHLDFTAWDRTVEFWKELNKGAQGPLKEVAMAFSRLVEGGRREERLAILCKAWGPWLAGTEVTAASVAVKTTRDKYGIKRLVETPGVGGIDVPDEPRTPVLKPDDEEDAEDVQGDAGTGGDDEEGEGQDEETGAELSNEGGGERAEDGEDEDDDGEHWAQSLEHDPELYAQALEEARLVRLKEEAEKEQAREQARKARRDEVRKRLKASSGRPTEES
jgi:hypothetical protein